MAATKRIYVVGGTALVRAYSKQAARSHVAMKTLTAEVADQETLIKLIRAGEPVQEVSAEQTDLIEESKANE